MRPNFRRNRRSFLLLFSVLFLGYSNAQTVQSTKDVFYANYFATPKTDLKDANGTISQNVIDVKINTPTIKVGENLLINNVFSAKAIINDIDTIENMILPFPEELYELNYSLPIRHSISESWKMIYIPSINVRSDFAERQFNKDLLFPQVLVAALKTSKKNPDFRWGFGINYNNNQAKNSILPVLVLLYSKPKMNLNIRLPQSATITFMPSKKNEYGFSFNLEGSITNLQNEAYPEAANYLQRQNFYLFPYFSKNITSNLWLNLKGGILFNNTYNFVNDNYKSENETFENSLQPTIFMQLGISYRLNK
ncbi:DUF6268 family outer membrane beta-barrel protein [Aquimarina pacifica]|uniref:DUF6268 family outer membrane beta-barrel protein n=1 Tax=Aquimarina pacifica TaxID=1296415 RepID=UPI00046FA42A|nr:DUF6268 family outer membrane beta-barrel protein [Aquimarina pacifica]